MHTKTLLSASFLVLLSACSGKCSCETVASDGDDDGAGGSGTTATGTGTHTPTGAGGEGTGGEPATGVGGNGGAGVGGGGIGGGGIGGGDDGVCPVAIVDAPGACDADCDGFLTNEGVATMCTTICGAEGVCPEQDDGTVACVVIDDVDLCVYTCEGADACPTGYLCDQTNLICLPESPDE